MTILTKHSKKRVNDPYYMGRSHFDGGEKILLLPRGARGTKSASKDASDLDHSLGRRHFNLTVVPMWYERERKNYNNAHPYLDRWYTAQEKEEIKKREIPVVGIGGI